MTKKGTVFKKYTEAFKLKDVHLYENGERSCDTISKELKMPSPTPLKNIYGSILNYSPLNVLTDCLKWEIPKYGNLTVSNSLGYPRSSYG
ncbi:hypothetical protein [Bacillus mycoides]|uniref:hypothetical protein n=1 Tax=Bacillus mycoides TaxID=1405 RepID=UPI0003DBAE3C|nr:hypothetical protein [Bacillus mycoides]GAE43259.1 hypothetical protein BW1_084_00170 [Bacillus mycoides NBRC 101238 = DSM 11821]